MRAKSNYEGDLCMQTTVTESTQKCSQVEHKRVAACQLTICE